MSKRWAYIIIMTVATVVVWSGWEIYKAFKTKKDVGQYIVYSSPISQEFDVDLINEVSKLQEKVLIKDSDITPQE